MEWKANRLVLLIGPRSSNYNKLQIVMHDIHHHNPDVLNTAVIRASNIQYDIQNLNKLLSDHNPIMIKISGQARRSSPLTTQKIRH